MERGFFAAKREIHTMQREMKELRSQITNLESLRHSQTRLQSDLKQVESEISPLTKRLTKLEEDQRATHEATQKSRSVLHRLIHILRGKPSEQ